MPKFPVEEEKTAEQLLYEHVIYGLKERLQTAEIPSPYVERLQYELQTINSMGYADYF